MEKLKHETNESRMAQAAEPTLQTIESRMAQAANLTVQSYLIRLSAIELEDKHALLTIPEVREMLTTLAKYTERLNYYLTDGEHYNKSLYEYMYPNS